MIKQLYKLPLEIINTPPGIYFLCKEKQIVYIGQSISVGNRILSHLMEGQKEFDEVYYIPCHVDNLDIFEDALIRFFAPPYNKTVIRECKEEDKRLFETLC